VEGLFEQIVGIELVNVGRVRGDLAIREKISREVGGYGNEADFFQKRT
jgi:hypothetical protein